MPTRDEETGRFTQEFDVEEFIEALQSDELDTPAATSEVAAVVGCDHDTAYKKLRAAEDDGRVGTRKAGNTRLWWVNKSD